MRDGLRQRMHPTTIDQWGKETQHNANTNHSQLNLQIPQSTCTRACASNEKCNAHYCLHVVEDMAHAAIILKSYLALAREKYACSCGLLVGALACCARRLRFDTTTRLDFYFLRVATVGKVLEDSLKP